MSIIQKPCYWYTDQSLPVEEQIISAICLECQKKHSIKGWYWAGDINGYGDYDLNCSKCNLFIHQKSPEEINEQNEKS